MDKITTKINAFSLKYDSSRRSYKIHVKITKFMETFPFD